MKTFETEKHNIPEGATHHGVYGCDTDVYFKKDNGVFLQWHHENWSLSQFAHHKWVKPIPQTNIETPEEKEVLDLIDTTPHQYEVSKFSGNEWGGEGEPPIGVECNFTPRNTNWGFNHIEDFTGTVLHYEGEQFVFMLNHTKYNLEGDMVIVSRTDKGDFSKPETPQQREERERLEAAYDLYLIRCHAANYPIAYGFHEFKSAPEAINGWLAVVDKANYRKEG